MRLEYLRNTPQPCCAPHRRACSVFTSGWTVDTIVALQRRTAAYGLVVLVLSEDASVEVRSVGDHDDGVRVNVLNSLHQ